MWIIIMDIAYTAYMTYPIPGPLILDMNRVPSVPSPQNRHSVDSDPESEICNSAGNVYRHNMAERSLPLPNQVLGETPCDER